MGTINLSEAEITEESLRILLYGEAGAGKTHLLGGFPKPLKVHSFDNKLKPLYGVVGASADVYTLEDVQKCTVEFKRFMESWKKDAKDPDIKTLALDPLTFFDILVLKHFSKEWGGDPTQNAQIQHYGSRDNFYEYFFTYMVNGIRGKYVVVTAHEEYHVDEESALHAVLPHMKGNKFVPKLPSMFEEVWYLERKGGKDGEQRTLWYQKHRKALGSSQVLKGAGFVEDPTFDKIMKELGKGRPVKVG